ncbi:hypothetical protein HNP84_009849 [Thermocatellispora tengchongensis]|uniref:ABC transporter permease n=1 Tax=Thermocatellispora tengchongensis TaxID=1073253 RepID=A0A840PF84_9ACTN|nr:hypothetical protein [Thermocatellispora tengchongensis]MBB5140084.1 hypothetical protein [Thermocatellispora tengchongensis]
MRKIIGAIVGTTLIGMVFALSFIGSFHQPEPHGVPIAVVGPQEVAGQLGGALARRAPDAFELRRYEDEAAARAALLDREVQAVLVPQAGRLVVAGAGGRTGAAAITGAFQAAAQAQGRPLAVEDAAPLPPGDSGGISGMFYVISLVIPGLALGVALPALVPGAAGRIGWLLAGAAVIAAGDAWLVDQVFGALPGAYPGLWAVSAALVLTVAAVAAGLTRFLGTAGAGLTGLLFVVVGVPASGGPIGAYFIPEWYAAVGRALPVGHGAEAIRNVVFFDGAALTTPLLVLGAWALVGIALLALPGRRPTPEPPAERIDPVPVG